MVYIPATNMGLLNGPEDDNRSSVDTPVGPVASTPDVAPPPVEATPPTPPEPPRTLAGPTSMASGLDSVDADKSTVAGQLDTLLGSDSRYITEARRRGTEQAAGRGLLNSSAAAGMAEREALAAGIDIAKADAGTYATAQGLEQKGNIDSILNTEGYKAESVLQEELAGQKLTQSEKDAIIQENRDKLTSALAGEREKVQQAATTSDINLQGTIAEGAAAKLAENTKIIADLKIEGDSKNTILNNLGRIEGIVLNGAIAMLGNEGITDVQGALDVIQGIAGDGALGSAMYDPDLNLTGSKVLANRNVTAPEADLNEARRTGDAPSTMTPGQTDDPLWEKLMKEGTDAHIARFGIDWNTSKTTDGERAGALRNLQAMYDQYKGEYYK